MRNSTITIPLLFFNMRLPSSTGSKYGVPLFLYPQEYLQHLDLTLLQAQYLSLGNFIPDSTPQGNYFHGTLALLHSCKADPITATTPALPSSMARSAWMGEMPQVQHSLLSAPLANHCQKRHSTDCVHTETLQ